MFCIFWFLQICNINYFNGFLKIYIVFVFIFLCVVVVLNIVIFWILFGKEDIGYGNKICFIDNNFLRLVIFIIFVCLMCLLNLLFFVIIIIFIRKVFNVLENKFIRSEFRIFCCLFIIIGILWVFQIIDGYFFFLIFLYVMIVINSF